MAMESLRHLILVLSIYLKFLIVLFFCVYFYNTLNRLRTNSLYNFELLDNLLCQHNYPKTPFMENYLCYPFFI